MDAMKIAVIGGDRRLAYMIPELIKKGCRTAYWGIAEEWEREVKMDGRIEKIEEALAGAAAVVCGIPFSRDGMLCCASKKAVTELEFCGYLQSGQSLFGGCLSAQVKAACRKKGVTCLDFMEEETLAIGNAAATAEGSILTALLEQPFCLHGSRALVLGYGRCGRVLADKLKGLSVRVTVCARNAEQRAYAEAAGMETMGFEELEEKVSEFDYLFNTVPAKVMTEQILKKTSQRALIVDIVSGSGGADYAAAERLGVHAVQCAGLPGKYAPVTSAEKMAEFIWEKMLHEMQENGE